MVDANRQMVTDAKGGLNSYKVIKAEITDVVGNLSAGTLFNVMIVDRRKNKVFKSQLVPAGQELHQQLIEWMRPINANADNPGLEGASGASQETLEVFSDRDINQDFGWSGNRENETAFVTQLTLEQDVDAIFMIAGYHRGFERVRRMPTEREHADWQLTKSSSEYQEQLAEHQQEVSVVKQRINSQLAKINKERKAKGQPPRVLAQRHGAYSDAQELGLNWKTEHPGRQQRYYRDSREIL